MPATHPPKPRPTLPKVPPHPRVGGGGEGWRPKAQRPPKTLDDQSHLPNPIDQNKEIHIKKKAKVTPWVPSLGLLGMFRPTLYPAHKCGQELTQHLRLPKQPPPLPPPPLVG